MATTFIQSKSAGFGSGGGAAHSITFSANVQSGNSIIVAVTLDGPAAADTCTVTDSRGQSYTKVGHSTYNGLTTDTLQVWYLSSSQGGALTITATKPNTTGALAFAIHEYYGPLSSPQFFAGPLGVQDTHPTSGAVPITGSGVFVFAAYKQGSFNLGSISIAPPFTMRENVLTGFSTEGVGTADWLNASVTATATWTWPAANAGWSVAGAAFQPAAGSGGSGGSGTGGGAVVGAQAQQNSQSGRKVDVVAVVLGNVYYSLAGTNIWTPAANVTGKTLATTGVVRSAANNQKLWFADGTTWLYFDPALATPAVLSWVASAGVLPGSNLNPVDYPRLICTWRGRTVVSGIRSDGQNWFMSAVNDPTNWNYAPFPFVTTSAVVGNNSSLGLIGDVITSLVPYRDDTLLFGGDHTIWMCAGDPAAGGQITLISDGIGMAWGNAWAKGPDGTLYFMSNKTGIYAMVPGETKPQRMSQAIEQLLENIDTGLNIVRVQWDDEWQGLHVFITLAASLAACTHFYWEQRTGAWWTDVFPDNNFNPLCCVTFDGNTAGDRHCLLGGQDGYVRTLTPANGTDDGVPVASSVVIGPLLTKDLDTILLKDIQGILAANSGTVTWAVYVGATAEIALASVPVATGTWGPGRNPLSLTRWSGHAVYVKITATSAWAMEAIRCRIQTQGKVQRRGL